MREKFKKIRGYFEDAKEQKLEKFYLQADMFDPRFQELEDPFQKYDGKPAAQHIKDVSNLDWMNKRSLGDKNQQERAQKDFIKDIFVAIDEDGSGTMDENELVKALLSLGLSQDLNFA